MNEVRAAAPTGPRAGIVLAGGRSTRFGSDKLAADRGGRPLVHLAIEALAAVCGEVIVVVSATGVPLFPADLGVPIRLCRDRASDGGPLVGLIAGLQETLAPTIVVVGGDMPGLVPAVLTDLLDRLRAGTDAAALLEGDALRPLPSAMVRDVALAAALALPTGRSGIRDLLARLRTERVPEADWKRLDPAGASLLDVDRPEDLARLD